MKENDCNQEEEIMDTKQSLDTICIQGGWKPKNGEPRVLPIYQSTTFKYETSEQMGYSIRATI